MNIFDRTLGGTTRARIAQIIAVVSAILAVAQTIDWKGSVGAIVLALIQTVAHDTKIGDAA